MLGPVFRAHDASGDRLVAIKVFRLDLTPERAQQLATELQGLVELELTHPVIASPIAAGVEGSVAYLAETYVPAESLDVALRHFGPPPFDEVLRLVAQLAGAIDFAGAVGAFHGGLHPRDVLVSTDEVRLTGFGVAPALERVGARPPVRRPYSAPERSEGGDWGRPADVYSLAAIVHELLFGRRIAGTAQQVVENLGDLAGADREKLRAAFGRALAADPAERYPNALSFASALRDAATGAIASADEVDTIQTRPARKKVPEPREIREQPQGDETLPTLRAPQGRSEQSRGATMPALPFAVDEDREPVTPPTIASAAPRDEPTDDTSPTVRYAMRDAAPEADEDLPIRVDDPEPQPPGFGQITPAAPDRDLVIDPTPATMPALHMYPDLSAERFADLSAAEAEAAAKPGPLSEADTVPEHPMHVAEPATSPEIVAPPPRRGSALALAAMFALGLLVGALGGYEFAARRGGSPPESAAPATASAPPAGRDATEVAVEPASRTPPPSQAPPASAGQGRPSQAAPASAGRGRPAVPPPAPATATPPAPASAAAARPGRILIRSTPAGAQVTIDGDDRGVTPLTVRDLPYGTYSVSVARRGYAAQTRRVAVTRARPAPAVSFALRAGSSATPASSTTGSMSVESRPAGAIVYLNHQRVGQTPAVLPSLKSGSYAVRLEHPGYRRWTASIRVQAGRQARVTASLEPSR